MEYCKAPYQEIITVNVASKEVINRRRFISCLESVSKVGPPAKKAKLDASVGDSSRRHSDDQPECPICTNLLSGEVAKPECCDHQYCVPCLMKWSERTHTCPMDRGAFELIFIFTSVCGSLKKRMKAPPVKKTPEEIEAEEQGIDAETIICRVCRLGDHEECLMLCDGCQVAYHTYCLPTPLRRVPRGDWFCPRCTRSRGSQSSRTRATSQPSRRRSTVILTLSDGSTSALSDEERPTRSSTSRVRLTRHQSTRSRQRRTMSTVSVSVRTTNRIPLRETRGSSSQAMQRSPSHRRNMVISESEDITNTCSENESLSTTTASDAGSVVLDDHEENDLDESEESEVEGPTDVSTELNLQAGPSSSNARRINTPSSNTKRTVKKKSSPKTKKKSKTKKSKRGTRKRMKFKKTKKSVKRKSSSRSSLLPSSSSGPSSGLSSRNTESRSSGGLDLFGRGANGTGMLDPYPHVASQSSTSRTQRHDLIVDSDSPVHSPPLVTSKPSTSTNFLSDILAAQSLTFSRDLVADPSTGILRRVTEEESLQPTSTRRLNIADTKQGGSSVDGESNKSPSKPQSSGMATNDQSEQESLKRPSSSSNSQVERNSKENFDKKASVGPSIVESKHPSRLRRIQLLVDTDSDLDENTPPLRSSLVAHSSSIPPIHKASSCPETVSPYFKTLEDTLKSEPKQLPESLLSIPSHKTSIKFAESQNEEKGDHLQMEKKSRTLHDLIISTTRKRNPSTQQTHEEIKLNDNNSSAKQTLIDNHSRLPSHNREDVPSSSGPSQSFGTQPSTSNGFYTGEEHTTKSSYFPSTCERNNSETAQQPISVSSSSSDKTLSKDSVIKYARCALEQYVLSGQLPRNELETVHKRIIEKVFQRSVTIRKGHLKSFIEKYMIHWIKTRQGKK